MRNVKKTREIREQKVVAYYFLAIVFPCVILGILAFRGIRNDQALIEREQRREVQEITNVIIATLDERLDSIEYIVEHFGNVKTQDIVIHNQELDSFLSTLPEVVGIFAFHSDNSVHIVDNDLAFFPDQGIETQKKVMSRSARSVLEKGWTYEFQQQKYHIAITYYQVALQKTNDHNLRGDILNAIARIQKKQDDNEGAISTYNRISQDYSDVYLQGKISLGLTALQELALLYLNQGDTVLYFNTTNKLLIDLKDRKWTLNQSYFQFTVNNIKEMLSQMQSKANSNINQLLGENLLMLDSLELNSIKTKYLFQILQEGPSLNSALPTEDHIKRITMQRNGNDYFISLLRHDESSAFGIIHNLDSLQESIQNQIRSLIDSSDATWEIITHDTYEPNPIRSGSSVRLPISVSLPSYLPSWSLIFYPIEKGLISSFMQASGGVYFYIFIVILIILTLGLVFILHAVNTEIKLSKMKSNFMSTVSHEFKSPLASIRQMSEMLDQNRVPDPNRKQYYYSAILQQSERLTHLIENILDFSRMEENQKIFRFEKGDIVRLVEDAIQYYQNLLEDKGFEIALERRDEIPEIEFDRDAIEQVLHNLLDNACKFSGKEKKVYVKLEYHKEQVTISIKDLGIGIKKEELDKVFNRFYRTGDSIAKNIKGSGIGLTIVKQIIEAHRGQIILESEPGEGSVFIISLPLTIKE